VLIVVLSACDSSSEGLGGYSEADCDYGYDDGYAVGYNSTCKIRTTMVKGDWDNKEYSRCYNLGQADGSRQCLADGGPKR
jgi:hypothetical protein